ncbi:MAG TPA: hypothetical protein VLK84_30035 [Longimicrobium sp.]|nr:hypothetical protein [Longimicrobium sp.]
MNKVLCAALLALLPLPVEAQWRIAVGVGPGWNTGGGVEMAVGRGRVFAEVRAHELLEGEGMAGALPLTVGVSF